jgi:DNA-3-methyladenine glycosylase II
MPIANNQSVAAAVEHLQQYDPILTTVITHAGLCTIRPQHDYYLKLISSIISQQLSVKAADSIERRFIALFDGHTPNPSVIGSMKPETLRSVGLSSAKVGYIQDLAVHILDGRLEFADFESLSNEQIISKLTAIKGIGEWTAHMFLMFSMGRLNVLAKGDLGIRNGIRKLYSFADIPTPKQVQILAKNNAWYPYETVACWYIWRSLDVAPAI